ncbi:MAG: hypothetical protein MUF18_20020 [Fimbriiglobus sp.]|jgi:hypothetical protein|nr:hypothetical protein [Fimbriiglobus sp.]
MRVGWWIPITVCGVLLAVVAGNWAAVQLAQAKQSTTDPTARTGSPPPSPLFVPNDKLNAGDVWESTEAILAVPVHNRTDQQITIDDFAGDCHCTRVTPRQLTIPARGSADVQVTIDTIRRGVNELGQARRLRSVSLIPVANGVDLSPPLVVRYTVVSRMTLNRLQLSFGEVPFDQVGSRTQTVEVTAHVPFHTLHASCASGRFGVRVQPISNDPNRFKLSVSPTLSVGFSGEADDPVVIELRDDQGNTLDRQKVNVAIRVSTR